MFTNMFTYDNREAEGYNNNDRGQEGKEVFILCRLWNEHGRGRKED